jgi:hypothetical protein
LRTSAKKAQVAETSAGTAAVDGLSKGEKQAVASEYYSSHKEAPIGDASMDKDGTIHLHLKRSAAVDTDANITYRTNSPFYGEVLKHLDGIKPGQVKLVAPWPETQSDSKTPQRSLQKRGSQ